MSLAELKRRPDDETTFVPKAPRSFDRGASNVQNWIEKSPDALFPPEPGRYHIFVNYGCGWCNQLLMVCNLRGLTKTAVGVTHTGLYRGSGRGTPSYQGYVFAEGTDTSGNGFTCMRDVYNADGRNYGANQLTVPVLFDKKTKRVVSNDPAQIHLMLDLYADELRGCAPPLGTTPRLYPPALASEIEAVNAVVFPHINNGVYCAWFAGSAAAFEEGHTLVQEGLAWLEHRLGDGRDFLCATEGPTLADVRAFPHLIRFDLIYRKLMLRDGGAHIFDEKDAFPKLRGWIKRMFAIPAVFESLDLPVAGRFYFSSKPVAEADAIYDAMRERMKAADWLPSREEWARKRRNEGLTDAQIHIPHPR